MDKKVLQVSKQDISCIKYEVLSWRGCEMLTNCCVLLCTKKDKRDKETGEKISLKQWIHAIRRDVGLYFSVNEGTRVCSRHF